MCSRNVVAHQLVPPTMIEASTALAILHAVSPDPSTDLDMPRSIIEPLLADLPEGDWIFVTEDDDSLVGPLLLTTPLGRCSWSEDELRGSGHVTVFRLLGGTIVVDILTGGCSMQAPYHSQIIGGAGARG